MSLISSETEVYQPLEEVQSVISSLVENIYNDESYQTFLNDLKVSDTVGSNKKLELISNTFTDIKVFNTSKDPLFLMSDIGIILGVSSINTMTKNYLSTEKLTGRLLINSKLVSKSFLTRHGVYRVMFNNKSKLSDVFRAFIYKLLDYMETNGKEITRSIMNEIAVENPDMINDAKEEYTDGIARYKHMYLLEHAEKKQLELTINKNYELFKEVEDEKNDIEISHNYSKMYITQLKKERVDIMERISNIKEDNQDDTFAALEFMKKKYFKEYSISLVHPSIVKEIFTSTKFPIDIDPKNDYVFNQFNANYDFNIRAFEANQRLNEDEIFYLTISLKGAPKEVSKEVDSKELCIATDFINDKAKFLEMLELIKKENDCYHVPGSRKTSNQFIYKISIGQIKSIGRDLITT